MASCKAFHEVSCYVVQRRNYERHQKEGQLEIIACYRDSDEAHKHGRAVIEQIYRAWNKDSKFPKEGTESGCYKAEIVLFDDQDDRIYRRVVVSIIETKLREKYEEGGEEKEAQEDKRKGNNERTVDDLWEERHHVAELATPNAKPVEHPKTIHHYPQPAATTHPLQLPKEAADRLSGMYFALAGTQDPFNRAQVASLIKQYGGIKVPMDPVGNHINFVIIGSDVERDMLKLITQHNIKRVSQRGFFKIIDASTGLGSKRGIDLVGGRKEVGMAPKRQKVSMERNGPIGNTAAAASEEQSPATAAHGWPNVSTEAQRSASDQSVSITNFTKK